MTAKLARLFAVLVAIAIAATGIVHRNEADRDMTSAVARYTLVAIVVSVIAAWLDHRAARRATVAFSVVSVAFLVFLRWVIVGSWQLRDVFLLWVVYGVGSVLFHGLVVVGARRRRSA